MLPTKNMAGKYDNLLNAVLQSYDRHTHSYYNLHRITNHHRSTNNTAKHNLLYNMHIVMQTHSDADT